MKTSGPETFDAVISALKPLREKGYLTYLKDNRTVNYGPVTVIGTGNTPLNKVASTPDRDYFFDAPLDALDDPQYEKITSQISPIASASFKDAVGVITSDTDPILNDEQTKALRSQITVAKERGIGARYWETPYYPIRTRNLVWRTLLREGVTLLNADDLEAVGELF